MTKIIRLNKAIEEKQKRMETKEKYNPLSTDERMEKLMEEIRLFNKDLVNKYKYVVNEYKDLAEWAKNIFEREEHNSYLNGLVEHFIVKNKLEDQFIDFLKEVAEKRKRRKI